MNKIQPKLLIIAFIFFAFAQVAPAQTTTFTYQGRLTDASTQANGTYDLGFALFDAASGGTQIGTAQTRAAVTVANGIFTVQLDFGAAAFPGANRFLQIAVKKTTETNFTTLTPRQPVTSTPYAIRAVSADTADNATNAANLGGTPANQFVQTFDGRLSNERAPTAGSGNCIQNTTTQQTGNFSVSGSGAIGGNLTVGGTINGTATNATNATNAAQLGGVAANQYLTTTSANSNFIQNTTTQQTGNFNVSGGGTVGGTLAANTLDANSSNNRLLNANSSSAIGTWLTLNNTTTGGRQWSVISTGASNVEGAGKLLFYDTTTNTGRLLLSDAGANITGNLTVTGAINGTVSNATNATNVSGGFVQLPLTTGAPPASECNAASQYGRQKVDAGSVRLYICTAAGWKSVVLQ